MNAWLCTRPHFDKEALVNLEKGNHIEQTRTRSLNDGYREWRRIKSDRKHRTDLLIINLKKMQKAWMIPVTNHFTSKDK